MSAFEKSSQTIPASDPRVAKVLAAIAEAAARLRFGAIQLTVHEGRIVQLDVTEKQRFT
jgi:hypothetical protein